MVSVQIPVTIKSGKGPERKGSPFLPVIFFTVAVGTCLFPGCLAKRYQKIQEIPIQTEATILYANHYHNESKTTSTVKVSFGRTGTDRGFCELVLEGKLSSISAAVLFPEDVTVIHSQVRYQYMDNGIWYEKTGKEPPRILEVLDEELAPLSIPGHILPYGFDSGYRFMRKLLKRSLDGPTLNDDLENEYDAVAIAFMERKGVEAFLIRIPLEGLNPLRIYDLKVIAEYYDGETRRLNGDAYLILE
ncbi:MAG: hypothetical protein C4520_12790 [Candidatus Abyssobacteria bacterium SURF_5]|uniref:Uncharacterized protein n=1 Tax=Abyssobacteria bacterium (strain SURF_5) TaxID=2093360 RepID=A0A3A4NEW2_ABYX5|nr:MAG: hypothetical protein C4520_12790 [Candidatus Abyssubacteria bacterium SURF_5]